MKTIVVPVNFSENSNNAARYAADLAMNIHAGLYLFHALQMPVSSAEFPMTAFVFEEMEESAEEGLQQLKDELVKRTAGQVDIQTNLEVGGVEYCTEDICTRKNPFLVIMGSSGSSWEKVIAGNHLAQAMRHLPHPLIVVPENAVFHPIKKIVLACDLDDMAGGIPASTHFLKELQDLFKAGFEVINIDTGKQEGQREAERSFEFNAWQQRLHEIYPEVHFLSQPKVEDGINAYLSKNPADLLLVFPKKHGFLEFHKSYSKKIAMHCPVPVMSVHGTDSHANLLFS